ncbi:hypothetical protein [Deinococcus budaensis]|uniref:Uncharacterized protein n=1 Tax=Deinococcus budaensis TaxID=1665626 RepID=A0A7W8GCJ0_9DEIO|nr:hypothetical protein [Deinococcus budaensis]MBB5232978.1 hypothetical protein [Deinococcus budaensis]
MQQMSRLDANRALLTLLLQEVEAYPDLRLGQVLVNLGVLTFEEGRPVDPFYEEPSVTLRRVRQSTQR